MNDASPQIDQTQIHASDTVLTITELRPQARDNREVLLAKIAHALGGGATAGSEAIVKSVGISSVVSSAVVFTDTNARATGDYCGTDTAPQAFASAVRVSGGTGVVKSITITDYTTTAAVALELWLFSATFTAPADNAAWTVTDAHALTCLGVIPIATDKWYASGANKVYSDDTLSLVIKPAATSLYYAIVARGTTPAWTTAAGLQISLGILQD